MNGYIGNIHGIAARKKKKRRCRFSKALTIWSKISLQLLSLLTEGCIIYGLLPSNKASQARTKNPGLGEVDSKSDIIGPCIVTALCGAGYFRLSQRRRYHWWFRVSAHSFNRRNNQWLSFDQLTNRYCLLPVVPQQQVPCKNTDHG
jgi:hypothetical protein